MKDADTFLQLGDVIEADSSWSVYDKARGRLQQDFNDQGKPTATTHKPFLDELKKGTGKKFVVVRTDLHDGSSLQGYADGHDVTIKQLKKNGTFNPDAPSYVFYQSGSFICKVTDVKKVGKMQQTFV